MEISGKLHAIFETKQVTDRFTKREFVIETADAKYPQRVIFELTGDRCDKLDSLKVGQTVRVEFNLRGREWTSPKGEVKYFNSLSAWTVEGIRLSRDRDGYQGDEPPPPSDSDYQQSEDIPF